MPWKVMEMIMRNRSFLQTSFALPQYIMVLAKGAQISNAKFRQGFNRGEVSERKQLSLLRRKDVHVLATETSESASTPYQLNRN